MPQLSMRSLVRFGKSVGVTLPRGWIRYHGLKPGDKLTVISNGEITIKIRNQEEQNKHENQSGQS